MPPTASQLDLTFAALADPTRRAILARLAQGEATVNELVEPFDMSQPAITLSTGSSRGSSHRLFGYAVHPLPRFTARTPLPRSRTRC